MGLRTSKSRWNVEERKVPVDGNSLEEALGVHPFTDAAVWSLMILVSCLTWPESIAGSSCYPLPFSHLDQYAASFYPPSDLLDLGHSCNEHASKHGDIKPAPGILRLAMPRSEIRS